MEHRLCNNFKPMIEEDSIANMMYTVIGCREENGSKVYDCISNRFEQAKLSEVEVKTYIKIGIIASGAKLDGDNIVVASLEYPKAEDVKVEKVVETKAVAEPKPEGKEPVVEVPVEAKSAPVEKNVAKAEKESVTPKKKN